MDHLLALPDERRLVLFDEAGARLGLSAGSVEKDLWVCWVLRALFALPASGRHLTFKGGTSLSKGWHLIQRFSEDLDIVLDRDVLGFRGAQAPELAPSQKQRAKRLDALRAACQQYVRDTLLPELGQALGASPLDRDRWRLALDPDDVDAQTILFTYPAVAARGDYVRPVVKIELGARSDTEPSAEPRIMPYVAEAVPDVSGDCAFTVRAVAPERTFWEKVALLHEEGHRTGGAAPKARLARHYYDVWALIQAGVADRAMAAPDLFARVAAHRVVFFRKSQEAQASLQPGRLSILPSSERRSAWKQDYQAMRESMFFGEAPTFDDILAAVAEFERRFNDGRA